jgi:hypothetical protein
VNTSVRYLKLGALLAGYAALSPFYLFNRYVLAPADRVLWFAASPLRAVGLKIERFLAPYGFGADAYGGAATALVALFFAAITPLLIIGLIQKAPQFLDALGAVILWAIVVLVAVVPTMLILFMGWLVVMAICAYADTRRRRHKELVQALNKIAEQGKRS